MFIMNFSTNFQDVGDIKKIMYFSLKVFNNIFSNILEYE